MTIDDVTVEEMPDQKKGKAMKAIISLRETKKQWLMNRTNGECVKAMFGRQTDDWIGKRVTLCVATITAFGEEQTAIRVRGSPDIENDITAEFPLGQDRKTVRVKLKKTVRAGAKAAPKAQEKTTEGKAAAPAENPPSNPSTGEIPMSEEEKASILANEKAAAGGEERPF